MNDPFTTAGAMGYYLAPLTGLIRYRGATYYLNILDRNYGIMWILLIDAMGTGGGGFYFDLIERTYTLW